MRHTALAVALVPLLALALAGPPRPRLRGTDPRAARLQKGVKSLRVSSYDETGGNNDRIEGLAPASGDLFNVKGAGVINHIWVTIAPPPPASQPPRHHLAHVLGWGDRAERGGADRRLLRAGMGRELPVLGPAPGRWPPRRPRDRELLSDALRERRPHRGGERLAAEDRGLLLLRRLRGVPELASRPGALPRVLQPRAHRSVARGRERVVGARARRGRTRPASATT